MTEQITECRFQNFSRKFCSLIGDSHRARMGIIIQKRTSENEVLTSDGSGTKNPGTGRIWVMDFWVPGGQVVVGWIRVK